MGGDEGGEEGGRGEGEGEVGGISPPRSFLKVGAYAAESTPTHLEPHVLK